MPRRIHNVDVKVLAIPVSIVNGAVLGQNGNTAFAFDRVGVENTFADQLAMAELAALA